MKLRRFNAWRAVLAAVCACGPSVVMAQSAVPAPAQLAALPAVESACTLDIGGIPVELGVTSFKQCVSYARSSLLGKTEKDSRDVHFANRPYRVGQTTLAQSLDGGRNWLTIEATAPARIGALDLAVMAPGVPASSDDASLAGAQSGRKAGGATNAAATPTPLPAPTQRPSPSSSAAGQAAAPRAASTPPMPAPPAVVETPKTLAAGAPSSATNPAQVPAQGPVPPAGIGRSKEPSNAMAALDRSSTMVVSSSSECRYQTAAGWLVAASSASSAKDCGTQILKKVGPGARWPVAGTWYGRRINVVYTTVYSSIDGVTWDTE